MAKSPSYFVHDVYGVLGGLVDFISVMSMMTYVTLMFKMALVIVMGGCPGAQEVPRVVFSRSVLLPSLKPISGSETLFPNLSKRL